MFDPYAMDVINIQGFVKELEAEVSQMKDFSDEKDIDILLFEADDFISFEEIF